MAKEASDMKIAPWIQYENKNILIDSLSFFLRGSALPNSAQNTVLGCLLTLRIEW